MSIVFQERPSDSPLITSVTRGETVQNGSSIRPAESQWHMVFVKHQGRIRPIVVGPWTTAGVARWEEGAEILWIRFQPGTFMPHLPFKTIVDQETVLPEASSHTFWLNNAAWQIPDFDHAELFVKRLEREGLLLQDPLVRAVLAQGLENVPERTVRHHFAQATGLTQTHIRQVERAREAAEFLRQGVAIPDVVYLAGYADQPHLTRALKKWIGYTPAQLLRKS
jgi:AraC-like DNA-binding protein